MAIDLHFDPHKRGLSIKHQVEVSHPKKEQKKLSLTKNKSYTSTLCRKKAVKEKEFFMTNT